MTSEQRGIQILRTIDKKDKIGRDGVVALLQKPLDEFGAGLTPIGAELIGRFLDIQGSSNAEVIDSIKEFARHAVKIRSRIDLMVFLEEWPVSKAGLTAWDALLAMPCNGDQTWRDNGRPQKIAWALDDIVSMLSKMSRANGEAHA